MKNLISIIISFLIIGEISAQESCSRLVYDLNQDTSVLLNDCIFIDTLIIRSYSGVVPTFKAKSFINIGLFTFEIGNNSLNTLLSNMKYLKCNSLFYSGIEKRRKLFITANSNELDLEISSVRRKAVELRINNDSNLKYLSLSGVKITDKLLYDLTLIKNFKVLRLSDTCQMRISLKKLKKINIFFKIEWSPPR